MNYRHAYHAGNFADVLKHALLCWIVHYLQQKEAPLCLIDTHAGAGVYDLTGTQAEKTGEAKDGIQRLIGRNDVPISFAPYLDLVRKANPSYPGSPALLSALARPHDKIILCELHPEEASQLRQSLPPSKHTRIITGDGYRTLPTLTPPPEKRGLVLIDPPFEKPEELETLTRNFASAHNKWPLATYILWFPIKDRAHLNRFKAELQNTAIKKLTLITMDIASDKGLSATGLVIANAPYTLEAEWRSGLQWLTATLAQGSNPGFSIEALA